MFQLPNKLTLLVPLALLVLAAPVFAQSDCDSTGPNRKPWPREIQLVK